jgi:PST family polysaccharide transporter
VALTSVLAAPMVALLYGDRWAPAAPVLRILVGLTLVRMVTGLAMDVLMGAGATRATLWLNLGWAAVLIPTLWWAAQADGIRGAAVAQTAVGFLVAVPLAAIALRRARVALAPVGSALVRPLLAAVLAAAVAVVVARFAGPYPIVQLFVAGSAGVLAYVPAAVPRDQLRQLLAALRRREAASALD